MVDFPILTLPIPVHILSFEFAVVAKSVKVATFSKLHVYRTVNSVLSYT
jgi:hypothetical protein